VVDWKENPNMKIEIQEGGERGGLAVRSPQAIEAGIRKKKPENNAPKLKESVTRRLSAFCSIGPYKKGPTLNGYDRRSANKRLPSSAGPITSSAWPGACIFPPDFHSRPFLS